jgi:hypothetical protein
MILRYAHLSRHPAVFQAMTGLTVAAFDDLVSDLLPACERAKQQRLVRPTRRRAPGGGRHADLCWINQLLLTVIWLRIYPTNEVLAYLMGVSDSTVSRVIARLVPLLEAAGKDTMRLPDPGRKRRRQLDELLRDTPELAVVIDTFEQRVQRCKDRDAADAHYSGKKKQHTLKSQVAVDEETGQIVDVADSVPGPTADITVLEQSGLMGRLPEGVGGIGDLAYVGIAKLHPKGLGASPRRKPRGKDRPPEDIAYNRAFSRRRIVVEHSIGRMRRYQALSQTDRHHRQNHSARVRAVAGLVNRHRPLYPLC